MKTEISAGAVVFRIENGLIKYLLLRYPAINHRSGVDYWDFVKGHLEPGETDAQTILREAAEETGLTDLGLIDGFCRKMEYFFTFEGKKIFKVVNFYLAKTNTEKITLSDEHNDFVWLPFDRAREALSFANAKQVLVEANLYLIENLKIEDQNES